MLGKDASTRRDTKMREHRAIARIFFLVCGLAGIATADVAPQAPGAVREAPPLQLQDLRGETRSLGDYRGNVVLVNFWASWCGPCIQEIPSLRALYAKMAGARFEILAVNVKEGRFKVHKFSRLVEMPFPILLDPDGEAFAAWDAQVLPTSFLIDAEGRVRDEVQGPLEWDADAVVQTIRALLPAAPAAAPARGATSDSRAD